MNAPVSPSAAMEASRASATPPPAPPRRPVRWVLLRVVPVVLLLAAAVFGTWYWRTGRFLIETDDAYVQGDISVLAARISADVAAISVADNQPVKVGDLLIELDRRDLSNARDQARATLAEAEAAIATLATQETQQQAQIDAAQAQIEQARAEQVRAASDARRTQALVGGGYASRQSSDQVVADQRKAEAAVTAAQAQLSVQQQTRGVLAAQLRQAEARRAQAAAALAQAETNLSYTAIRAPVDGIAGNRAAQLGQHVQPGQQLIAVAPAPERLYVVANFKETQLPRMRPGQPVEVTVDAIPGAMFHARVDSFAPATGSQFSLLPPENATGNFTKIVQRVPVKLVLEQGQDAAALARLRPGLSVVAEVDARADPDAPRGVWAAIASLF
ncbi:HlyD family secretion protein [Roseomonas haemaphysalidis]|uniref:HlyD family secretion protein n=1 Tax=Roseomonas haemaphysalidis TaxID=2768162 RepID=A0ABS3KR72_9PROT|nr:HlyD family secretion protein [Roseomonas haemaphysalidis]MBO1079939.1 HlyD family secretion protein [Roseomonas haemaphysalidis]